MKNIITPLKALYQVTFWNFLHVSQNALHGCMGILSILDIWNGIVCFFLNCTLRKFIDFITRTMLYRYMSLLYFLQGVAINFVRSDDIRILRDIEQYYSTQIDEMPMNVADLIWSLRRGAKVRRLYLLVLSETDLCCKDLYRAKIGLSFYMLDVGFGVKMHSDIQGMVQVIVFYDISVNFRLLSMFWKKKNFWL